MRNAGHGTSQKYSSLWTLCHIRKPPNRSSPLVRMIRSWLWNIGRVEMVLKVLGGKILRDVRGARALSSSRPQHPPDGIEDLVAPAVRDGQVEHVRAV